MKPFYIKKEVIHKHILFWIALTAFLVFVDPFEMGNIIEWIGTFVVMFSYCFTYYLSYIYVFPLFFKENKIKLILFSILIFVIYLFIRYLNAYVINPEAYIDFPVKKLLLNLVFLFLLVYFTAFSSYKNTLSIFEIKNSAELEKQILQNELIYYQNQFNKPFILNFLNYSYNESKEISPQANKAIELFNSLLEYTLVNSYNVKVSIKDEINYILCFIELKRLFIKEISILININCNTDSIFIYPGILICVIENSFKHGDILSKNDPVKINIENTKAGDLVFEVWNRKNSARSPLRSTMTGLNNVKKQLSHLYGSKFDLTIENSDNSYSILLTLQGKLLGKK